MTLEGGKTFARKQADRIEASKPPVPTPENEAEQPSLQEVIKERAFGEMLAAEKEPALIELGARLKNNATDPGDLKELAKWHKEYLDRGKRAEKLGEEIEKRFGALKNSSAGMEELTRFVPEEQLKQLMKDGWRELAYRNPKGFAAVEKKFAALAAAEKRIDDPADPVNKTLIDFCKKNKIDTAQFDTAFAIQSHRERSLEIRRLMRENMGIIGKVKDTWALFHHKYSALDQAQVVARHKDIIDVSLADIDKQLKAAAGAISKLYTDNPEMREALIRSVNSDAPAFKAGIESKMSYAEAAGRKIETAHLKGEWAKYLDDNGITDFSAEPAPMQDVHRNRFWKGSGAREGYVKEHLLKDSDKKGFWSSVLEYILGNKHVNDPKIKSILS